MADDAQVSQSQLRLSHNLLPLRPVHEPVHFLSEIR